MSELKCCPFCGGEAEMLNYSPTEWLVHCIECDGMVEKWRETEEEAIEQWNRRTPMNNIVEKLEEESYETTDTVCGGRFKAIRLSSAINIVKQEINNGLE